MNQTLSNLWAWIVWLRNRLFTDEQRVSLLEKGQKVMLKELQDLQDAAVVTMNTLGTLANAVKDEQMQIASLQQQIADLKTQGNVSAADLASLETTAQALAAANQSAVAALPTPPTPQPPANGSAPSTGDATSPAAPAAKAAASTGK